jgi:hypothetical protein
MNCCEQYERDRNYQKILDMRAEIERLRAHVDALEETLGLLVDHQNGCPLPSYADAWNLAMAMAKDLLEAKP